MMTYSTTEAAPNGRGKRTRLLLEATVVTRDSTHRQWHIVSSVVILVAASEYAAVAVRPTEQQCHLTLDCCLP